jgi:hypothetical protein
MHSTLARRRGLGALAAAGVAAVVTAAAVPARAAAAPALFTPRCARDVSDFIIGQTVPVAGVGFTPGRLSGVRLTWNGHYGGYADTNALSGFRALIFPPPQKRWQRRWTLTAVDQANPALRASRSVEVVKVGVVEPKHTHPSAGITRRLHGFANKTTYASFAFGGRIRATVKLGRPRGACGNLTKRMRALPARVRYGKWTIYYSYRRHFGRADARHGRYVIAKEYSASRLIHFRAAAASPARAAPGAFAR